MTNALFWIEGVRLKWQDASAYKGRVTLWPRNSHKVQRRRQTKSTFGVHQHMPTLRRHSLLLLLRLTESVLNLGRQDVAPSKDLGHAFRRLRATH